jgi:hypothetical protein
LAQVALATKNPVAGELIRACEAIGLVEAEARQHLSLSKAWLLHVESQLEEATSELQAARLAFGDPRRTGDHTRHLLARLSELDWQKSTRKLIDDWRAELGVSRRDRKPEPKSPRPTRSPTHRHLLQQAEIWLPGADVHARTT